MADTAGNIPSNVQIAGGAELKGSQQGAKRTLSLNQISQLNKEPFQTKQIREDLTREFGATRNPLPVVQTGGIQVNGAQSTKFPTLPEIGKGSITDSIV
ncbi:hypothetical protein UR09_02835 [Candidatus Nitromaritima sp. SCGC AAA799-A02]|nr:hypothetical protein UZ36_03990 [Candidatus Nitromaritima sp. SCGC AAA799-C22]KMP11620.1 hypothetical protein UR09_02835 [Candidatus Nitromaritima sp. SCGC AAA799-A02]